MKFKHFYFATLLVLCFVVLGKIENVAGTNGGSTIFAKMRFRRKRANAKIVLSLMVLAMFWNFHQNSIGFTTTFGRGAGTLEFVTFREFFKFSSWPLFARSARNTKSMKNHSKMYEI